MDRKSPDLEVFDKWGRCAPWVRGARRSSVLVNCGWLGRPHSLPSGHALAVHPGRVLNHQHGRLTCAGSWATPLGQARRCGRLPTPPTPGTASGPSVNPPVREQPRGNRCEYAKHDVADHALAPVRESDSEGRSVRQSKTHLPPLLCGVLPPRDAALRLNPKTDRKLEQPLPETLRVKPGVRGGPGG